MTDLAVEHVLAEQFDDIEQQHEAAKLGMWIFLATEVLFFGGLFLAYTVYRFIYPLTWQAASRHTEIILGGCNTGILLFSSTLMALAVRAAKLEKRKHLTWLLLGTAMLGMTFLGVKGYEYYKDLTEHLFPGPSFQWHEANPQAAELFFWIYYAMTGLHAVHVTIGVGVMVTLAVLAWMRRFEKGNYMPVEIAGLYWHFVDIVWVFLFPLLYMAGHRG
jgi:cytochrome c oxidase subunit 3